MTYRLTWTSTCAFLASSMPFPLQPPHRSRLARCRTAHPARYWS